MGEVYHAEDRFARRHVALKRVLGKLDEETPSSPALTPVGSFLVPTSTDGVSSDPASSWHDLSLAQEFRFLASLRHPNIISVLDFGFDSHNRPFFTMDWLTQAQDILTAAQDKSVPEKVRYIIQLLRALVYLHRRRILHRDLKPSNILVTADNQVKVLDFGLSEKHDFEKSSRRLSGTLAYIPPEVLGGAGASEASDLYAVGIIMYELLTGKHPFMKKGEVQHLVNTILTETPDCSAIEGDFLPIVQRLLQKSPAERYSSASEVLHLLARLIGEDALTETVEVRESFLQAADFVGRDGELSQLKASWKAAYTDKQAQMWLVGGESGVGKSRLMDELRIYALVNGAEVLQGQAVHYGGESYQLWRDVVRHLALENTLSEMEASVLKTLIPDIAEIVGQAVPDAPELDAHAAQERLNRVIIRLLRGRPQPTLILLEDLHWASLPSLILLQRIAEEMSAQPLMIMANYRSDERPELPATLPALTRMQLEPLPRHGIETMTRSVLGQATDGRENVLIDMLYKETSGNAFFVVEILRSLAEEVGSLEKLVYQTIKLDLFAGGLKTIIERRLERIPLPLHYLVHLAAVQGRVLDIAVLKALAHQADQVADLLAFGTEFNIFEAVGDAYRFAHDKLREGFLESIPATELAHLHQQIAETIEKVHASDLNQYAVHLAYHWAQTGNQAKEAHYAGMAGIQLLSRGTYNEALPLLERAADLYRTVPVEPFHLAKLKRQMGEAYFSAGRMDQAKANLQESVHLLGARFPGSTFGVVLGLLGEVGKQAGHRLLPSRLFLTNGLSAEKALEASLAYERLSHIIFFDNETAPLLYASMRSLNLAENAPDSPELARAYGTICYSIGLVPVYSLANFYERKAFEIAAKVKERSEEPWVWEITGYYSSSKGAMAQAVERYQRGADIAEKIGYVARWAECTTLQSMTEYQRGNFDIARKKIERIFDYAIKNQNLQALGWSVLSKIEQAVTRGRFDEALSLIDTAKFAEPRIGRAEKAWMYGILARLHALRGDVPATLQAGEESLTYLRQLALPNAFYAQEGYTGVVEAYLTLLENPQGVQRDDMQQKATEALKKLRVFGRVFPASRAHLQRIEGWYAWLNGQQAKAQKHWQQAIAEAEQFGKVYEQGLAYYDLGRFLGNRDHLQAAAAIFQGMDSRFYLEQVQAALTD